VAVDVGSAVGYLDLDISGFLAGLKSAQSEADTASKNIATKIGNNFQSVGKSLTTAGSTLTKKVTIPLVGIGTAGLKVATDFEKGMSEVKAISGATGKDFDALRAKAIELGGSTSFSANEVAVAMTEMAKAGWDSQQILDGMSGVLDAAAASGEDLGTVSTIVADAMTGFGMEAKESTRVADLLTQAANSGTIGINDLGESFKYIAPVAGSMGLSIEDVTTALSAMSQSGIKGSQAGTSLRGVLTRMVKPTDQVAAAMDELGIVLTNSDGTFKSLDQILSEMRGSFSGLTDEQKTYYAATLAGQEGMSGLLSLLNMSQEEYDEIAESMDNAGGVAEQTAAIMQDNLHSKIEQLGGALESLAIKLADYVIPYLQKFVEWLTNLVDKFTSLNPETQKTILALGGVAIAAGPVISIVGRLTSGVGRVVTAFGNLISKGGAAAGSIGSVGSAASGASGGVGSAAASFGNLAGQALKLVATGAMLMMVGVAIKMIADSAIEVANAGPGAAATFVLLAAVGVGMAAAITAIGGASTATAPGLLALGAAVLMVSGGVALMTGALSLVIDSMSNLVTSIASASTSLPLIAEYGGSAAAALTLLAGGVVLVSGAMLTLAVSTAAGLLPFAGAAMTIGLVDAALAAMLVTSGLAAAGMVALGASLTGVKAQMSSIERSAKTSAESLEGMVSSINIVDSFLNGLESTVKSVVKSFINSFSGIERPVSNFGTKMQTASSTATAAMSSMRFSARNESTAIVTSFNSIVAAVTSMSSKTIVAFNAFVSSFRSKANEVRSEIKSLEKAFSDARFEFDRDIKLPHFSMSGSFDPKSGSVPHVNVSWYRKAMASGMILNGATIFGFDNMTGSFLGGGEAGSEVVVGTSSLMRMIRMSVNASIMPFVSAMHAFIHSNIQLGYIARNVMVKQDEVISELDKAVSRTSDDGDTFIFYSPKAIDEIEAAKQMKKAKQDMAEGF
jgi:TP901 family phage tail tape measure protein